MAEWEAKRKAKPIIQRWLHMMVRRGQYRRLRRKAINARVEAELEPAAQALKVHVKAQASRVA